MRASEKKKSRQAPDVAPQASRREWIGLTVLALPALLISMDLSVLYLAVPRLSAALRPSSVQLLWITDVYGFLLAGSLIPMGALGDRIGRRKLLMIGGTAFGLASVLAAFSTSVHCLTENLTLRASRNTPSGIIVAFSTIPPLHKFPLAEKTGSPIMRFKSQIPGEATRGRNLSFLQRCLAQGTCKGGDHERRNESSNQTRIT